MFKIKFVNSLLLIVISCIGISSIAKSENTIILGDGVLLDSKSETIYISHPEKGIDSISIQTGEVVWHSDEADKPLLLRDSVLMALVDAKESGKLNLVALDSTTGDKSHQKTYQLPKDVRATANDGLHNKFNISVNYDENPLGDISWEYRYRFIKGAQLNEQPIKKDLYGKLALPHSKSDNGTALLNEAYVQILPSKAKKNTAVVEGKYMTQIEARQFKSQSREFIMVSHMNDSHSVMDKYRWEIYDKNNQLLGSILHYNSYRPFEVVGDTVLFVTSPAMNAEGDKIMRYPFMVNAFSLSSGTQKWTHEVKDHKYNGPYPH